jgi:hypothetical protein
MGYQIGTVPNKTHVTVFEDSPLFAQKLWLKFPA